jgi:hypothetical protein
MFGVPKNGTLVTYLEIIGKVSTNTSLLCHIPYALDIIAMTCLHNVTEFVPHSAYLRMWQLP